MDQAEMLLPPTEHVKRNSDPFGIPMQLSLTLSFDPPFLRLNLVPV